MALRRPVMKGFLKKIWDNFEIWIMVFLMAVFVINLFFQVMTRILFNYPLTFTEEVSRYCFLWMVLLGLSFATKYDRHIRITFITDRFPRIARMMVDILLHLLTIAIFTWVLINGIKYVSYSSVSVTPAIQIKRSYVVTILPICGFLMIVRSLERFAADVKNIFSKPSTEKESKTVSDKGVIQ
jgi:TRAP-type C4-dicarboxylate transport system permease small subunit